jgi:hypothetical protein
MALKSVQPSSKREGFATVPDVTFDDIGALRDVREELSMAILVRFVLINFKYIMSFHRHLFVIQLCMIVSDLFDHLVCYLLVHQDVVSIKFSIFLLYGGILFR